MYDVTQTQISIKAYNILNYFSIKTVYGKNMLHTLGNGMLFQTKIIVNTSTFYNDNVASILIIYTISDDHKNCHTVFRL